MQHLLSRLTVLLMLALLVVGPVSCYAQTYALEVSKSVVMPGERFNITVYSEYPYDTLLLFVTGPEGEAVNLTITRVYRGDVVGAPGVISVTVDEEGRAVFEVEAPEKPGDYLLELATGMGEVVASTTFTVVGGEAATETATATTPAGAVVSVSAVALVLLVVAVIVIVYWLWRHLA